MAHTADDNRKLPKYVTIDCVVIGNFHRKIIHLDDELKRKIVQKTWYGDLTELKMISGERYIGTSTPIKQLKYRYLAEVGVERSYVPCDGCRVASPFDCHFNAVWPPNRACTNCVDAGKAIECSLCK